MTSSTNLDKAIENVTKAAEKDKESNYEKALHLYEIGIEYFLRSIKFEIQSEIDKECIRDRCLLYVDRVEKLKLYLNKNKSVQSKIRDLTTDEEEEENPNELQKNLIKKKLEDAILVQKDKGRKWSVIVGLESAKEAIKEAVFFPMKFPHLFGGSRVPWRGILLFGPHGSGKSYLAKAVAHEAYNFTFFSVSPSVLNSKWDGDSAKLVKNLFELARQNKPSIIFIDEVDTLCFSHHENQSESTRNMKAEFLIQMQGIGNDMDGILVLGATSNPWMLDAAIRRLFEKRIYISLPDEKARLEIFQKNLKDINHQLTEKNLRQIATKTKGYSGADISIVVRDALMQPIRQIQSATYFKMIPRPSHTEPDACINDLVTPCLPSDQNATEMTWMDVPSDRLKEHPVTMANVLKSLGVTKPTVTKNDLKKFKKFMVEFGHE